MEHFTPVSALAGGLMIGIAAVVLLLFNGRIMGISGITRGIIHPVPKDVLWRVLFLVGLIVAPLAYTALSGEAVAIHITSSLPALIIGGFLVGLGTCTANGCTSGHSVCGLGRFSRRSLVATLTFMFTSIITVYVLRHVFGVAS
jgi:uncharacterized membrane protein YedE/YeeE